jgi:hypothetical protein
MPAKRTTTIDKISSVPNPTNSTIIQEFSRYMKENGSSELMLEFPVFLDLEVLLVVVFELNP